MLNCQKNFQSPTNEKKSSTLLLRCLGIYVLACGNFPRRCSLCRSRRRQQRKLSRHYQRESCNPATQDNLWRLARCLPRHQDPRPGARHPLVLVNPHSTYSLKASPFRSFSPQIHLLERPNSRAHQVMTHPTPGTYFHRPQGTPFLAKECSKPWSGKEDFEDAL